MKRICWIILAVFIFCSSFASCKTDTMLTKTAESLSVVYDKIRQIDFSRGIVNDNIVFLIFYDGTESKIILSSDTKIKNGTKLYKDNSQVYFILGGSVDDEYGILFVDGSTIDMSGLASVQRLGGNVYY